jgi:hypothetical protein
VEPGQVIVVVFMTCSSWRWSDDTGSVIELPAGCASCGLA